MAINKNSTKIDVTLLDLYTNYDNPLSLNFFPIMFLVLCFMMLAIK